MPRLLRTLAALTLVAALAGACGAADDQPTAGDDLAPRDGASDPVDGPDEGGEGGDLPDGGGATGGDAGGSTDTAGLEATTEAAVTDLAATTGVDPGEVEVVVAEPVTWADGSLGCPEPGQMYTQALVPGYRVVLRAAGDEVAYHAGADGDPRRCDDPQPPAQGGT